MLFVKSFFAFIQECAYLGFQRLHVIIHNHKIGHSALVGLVHLALNAAHHCLTGGIVTFYAALHTQFKRSVHADLEIHLAVKP